MKGIRTLLVPIATTLLCQSAWAADTPLGHVSLPKGKYVMTNTESGGSLVVTVDEHGVMMGSWDKAAAAGTPAGAVPPVPASVIPVTPAAAPVAVPAAVVAAPAAVPAAVPGAVPAAAGLPKSSSSAISNMIINKVKGEATRAATKALTGGQVNKLINKAGVGSLLK